MAEAALPLAVYLAKVVDERSADRARVAQDRTADDLAAENRIRVAAECTQHALDEWQPFVDDVRATIDDETGDQVALDDQLRQLVDQLQKAVREGEKLVRNELPHIADSATTR